jgi:hypothetical protein
MEQQQPDAGAGQKQWLVDTESPVCRTGKDSISYSPIVMLLTDVVIVDSRTRICRGWMGCVQQGVHSLSSAGSGVPLSVWCRYVSGSGLSPLRFVLGMLSFEHAAPATQEVSTCHYHDSNIVGC